MQSSQDMRKSRGGLNWSRSGIGGGDKDIERGEGCKDHHGVKMQTFGKTEVSAKMKVFPDDVSKESLLSTHGPGILKTMQVEISSSDEDREGPKKGRS